MLSSSRSSSNYRIFERFDIFGTPISIRFNNFQLHKTYYGTFVTVVLIVLLSLYSYSVMINCLTYIRPNVLFQENIVELPSRFDLTPDKFSIAMGIQDQKLVHFIDEQIYYLEVTLKETKKIQNPSTNSYDQVNTDTQIKMVPCTADHFKVEGAVDYFMKLKYSNLYCFPLDNQINLEGQFGALVYRRLYIQVKKCFNNNCKDDKTLKEKLSNVAFQMYYVNYAVKLTDKDQPFKPIGQNTFWQSGYSLFKNINVYFRKTIVNSDFGLFMEDTIQDERLIYSFDRETLVTQTDNKMYEIYINLEKNKESEYMRNYTKLYNGFSQIGGIFNILFCFGCLICLPLSRSSLEQKLMNQLFNFQEKRDRKSIKNNQNFEESQSSPLNIIQSQNQNTFKQSKFNTNSNFQTKSNVKIEQRVDREKILNKPINIHQQMRELRQKRFSLQNSEKQYLENTDSCNETPKRNSIQLQKDITNLQQSEQKNQQLENSQEICNSETRIHQKFASKLGDAFNKVKITMNNLIQSKFQNQFIKQKPFTKMINYGVEKLYNQLDIFYIMNKLIEIEKLKHLLLNENQIKLFEFIPKPTIYLSDFEEDSLDQEIRQFTSKLKNRGNEENKVTESHPKFSLLSEDNRDEAQKAKDAEDAFFQIFKIEKSTSRIDQKLIQLLDPELIQVLETNTKNRSHIQYKPNTCVTDRLTTQSQPIERRISKSNNQLIDNEIYTSEVDYVDFETNEFKNDAKSPPSDLKSYQLSSKNNLIKFTDMQNIKI